MYNSARRDFSLSAYDPFPSNPATQMNDLHLPMPIVEPMSSMPFSERSRSAVKHKDNIGNSSPNPYRHIYKMNKYDRTKNEESLAFHFPENQQRAYCSESLVELDSIPNFSSLDFRHGKNVHNEIHYFVPTTPVSQYAYKYLNKQRRDFSNTSLEDLNLIPSISQLSITLDRPRLAMTPKATKSGNFFDAISTNSGLRSFSSTAKTGVGLISSLNSTQPYSTERFDTYFSRFYIMSNQNDDPIQSAAGAY